MENTKKPQIRIPAVALANPRVLHKSLSFMHFGFVTFTLGVIIVTRALFISLSFVLLTPSAEQACNILILTGLCKAANVSKTDICFAVKNEKILG